MEDIVIAQAQELEQVGQMLSDAVQRKDLPTIFAVIAEATMRVAHAQEALLEIAKADMSQEIEAAVQGRAEQLAQELDADKSRRSFIGKRT